MKVGKQRKAKQSKVLKIDIQLIKSLEASYSRTSDEVPILIGL